MEEPEKLHPLVEPVQLVAVAAADPQLEEEPEEPEEPEAAELDLTLHWAQVAVKPDKLILAVVAAELIPLAVAKREELVS